MVVIGPVIADGVVVSCAVLGAEGKSRDCHDYATWIAMIPIGIDAEFSSGSATRLQNSLKV